MAKKPTYEELDLKVKALEKETLELRQTDKALKEQERLLNDVFESIQDGISVLDSELNIMRVNKAMKKWYSHRLPIEGMKCYQAYHGRDSVCDCCPTTRALKTGKLEMNEVPLTRLDGISGTLELFAFPMLDNSGNHTGVVEYVRDITQRKNAEKALGKAFNDLEKLVEERTFELKRINEKLEQEIEDRKCIEKALRENEEKYRRIFKNIQDVYYEVTLDGKILEISPSVEEISGYKRKKLIEKSVYDLYVDPKKRDEFVKTLLKNGKVTDYEILLKDKNNDQRFCSLNAKLVNDKHGKPAKIIGSLHDITRRKQMEKALRESEAQKTALLDASIDRIRYVNTDMKIIWANKATVDASDITPEDLVGNTCYQLFVGRDTPCMGCPTVTAIETGKMERAIVHQPKLNGIEGDSYWDNYCVPLKNDIGEIEGFIQIARNITEQIRAEEHIHTLTQELLRAQESERQRISRDLHDHVAQELSALKIGYETLFDNTLGIPSDIKRKVSEMSKAFLESIKAVRDLAYDLRPPVLDEIGLVKTLLQYCHDFSENNGITVDFHSAGMKDLTLDFDTEINLYRIVQEALTNTKKHADARHVNVKIVAAFPNVILRINDDGKGFDIQKRLTGIVEERRMGIRSMKERVKLLKGDMDIQSKPDQGTKILIKFPYYGKKNGS
ncbi:MAG: PAS domain S-box protein [Deltaproteobacteria bacterium]|nr:PAS domain S-box protein [Deltaproteobacteria bacterium]